MILSVIGFFYALDHCQKDHFSFFHAQLGGAVVFMSLLQPFITVLRPKTKDPNSKNLNIPKPIKTMLKDL